MNEGGHGLQVQGIRLGHVTGDLRRMRCRIPERSEEALDHALRQPSYLDHSAWQKQFHLRLAKTIATIIVKRGSENK